MLLIPVLRHISRQFYKTYRPLDCSEIDISFWFLFDMTKFHSHLLENMPHFQTSISSRFQFLTNNFSPSIYRRLFCFLFIFCLWFLFIFLMFFACYIFLFELEFLCMIIAYVSFVYDFCLCFCLCLGSLLIFVLFLFTFLYLRFFVFTFICLPNCVYVSWSLRFQFHYI